MLKWLFKSRFDLNNPEELGKWGEKRAACYLKKNGLKILEKNFSCKTGEIDIVAVDNDRTIVFVEVKTRSSEKFSAAQDAVNPAKRARLVRAANYFIAVHKIQDRPLRFDVITVVLSKGSKETINHFPRAFVS